MKKKIFVLFTVLCLILTLPVTALAAQETRMIQWVQTEPGKLVMLLAGQTEDGTYSAALDGQTLPVAGGTILHESLPVTVYCLVDTSGSISDFQMKLIRGTLSQISQSLSDDDNMVIATVSSKVEEGGCLGTEQERADAIATISSSYQNSNLNAGIVSSLNRLASATDLNPARVLVVLSDGAAQQKSGFTEQEVLDAIDKTRLPIFAVSLAEEYPDLAGSKLLGSYARSSCGGLHLTTVKENDKIRWDVTGQEFGAAIWKAISSFQYLTADLSQLSLDTGRSEARLTVTFTAGNSTYTDSLLLSTGELRMPEPETTEPSETAAEAATQEPEPEPQPEPGIRIPMYVWIAAGVLALAVAAAAIAAVKKNKAKRKAQEEAARREAEETTQALELPNETEAFDDPVSPPSKEAVYLELTDIPYGAHTHRFVVPLGEVVTFGRTNRAGYVLDSADAQLSGVHFSLILRDGMICVRDENSTNGTYINGISCVGGCWSKMLPGDKLRVGSREYRVTVSEEADGE